jgi:hypothetical protein
MMFSDTTQVSPIYVLFQRRIHSNTCNRTIHLPYLLDALILLFNELFEVPLLVDEAVDVVRLSDQHIPQLSVFRLPLTTPLLPLGTRVHRLSL